MPEFGCAAKPLIDRPGKATESLMPGIFSAMSLISRITFSVRSRLARAREALQQQLMKEVGRVRVQR